jgi:glycosyltransferase involved in cell wall biosynthesis
MRIGINTLPLFPGQIGGMESYVRNLVPHLAAIDLQHDFYLFVARYNSHVFELPDRNVTRVKTLSLQGLRYATRGTAKIAGRIGRRLPRVSRWLVSAIASLDLLQKIPRHRIDCWFCPLINLAPRHVTLPSVVSIPDLQPEFYPSFFPADLRHWARRRYPASCQNATRVITFSDFSRASIVTRYGIPAHKVRTIPLAVEAPFLVPPEADEVAAVRAKYGLPPVYAFYPANTWPHKNHVTLLEALRLLRLKHGVRLPCVFTGVERHAHEAIRAAIAAHSLAGQVRLLGYVERRDLPLLYRGALCLVFPSLFEGFGLPVLEAMAAECPVLCSRVTSLPEVAGDAALMFDARDPEGIADALRRILTDSDLRRALVRAGTTRVQQFSWERTARETLKVLEEAALNDS